MNYYETENCVECGGQSMPMDYNRAPPQPDSVSMNVSLNGSGSGGIRDLLDVLRNLEKGSDNFDSGGDEKQALTIKSTMPIKSVTKPETVFGSEFEELEEYDNEPDEEYYDIDDILASGDDLASKGRETYSMAGGGNPFAVKEDIISKLSALYEEVKSRY